MVLVVTEWKSTFLSDVWHPPFMVPVVTVTGNVFIRRLTSAIYGARCDRVKGNVFIRRLTSAIYGARCDRVKVNVFIRRLTSAIYGARCSLLCIDRAFTPQTPSVGQHLTCRSSPWRRLLLRVNVPPMLSVRRLSCFCRLFCLGRCQSLTKRRKHAASNRSPQSHCQFLIF